MVDEPVSLFDAKLKRGDPSAAIAQSVFEAEQAQQLAQDALVDLENRRRRIYRIAQDALEKHQLLE